MKISRFLLTTILLLPLSSVVASDCLQQISIDELTHLKTNKFKIDDDSTRNKLALSLVSCLSHPNPSIRDGITYEAYNHWLRNGLLNQKTIKTLLVTLQSILSNVSKDTQGFEQPFAALVLSEVVRVDRITPYLNNDERQILIDITTDYMEKIRDYRGFNVKEGWRHNVAHTADIFLQLVLNKYITEQQFKQILAAIKTQIAPDNTFYTFGEPKRLAMPFIYIVLQNKIALETITQWLNEIASSAPFDNWQSVYKSEQGLAKLHNTRNFLNNVYVITRDSKNSQLQAIQPALLAAIKRVN
ncbi:DUF2785 domain-containing protein [Thalassotalea sediminis]|uniref:DUF2785 domain-containing protein n=1 Tax=Thalassotalea sediminis TaxID=1759089 RepID=UPI0025746107|nr:DUF2785 domain-containing protein [Thalassotalea sediminis]